MTLTIRPIDLKSANEYVMKNHRHNGKVLVHRFSISCYDDDRLCGVAIVGNPSARLLDDGETVEIKRCCTDGKGHSLRDAVFKTRSILTGHNHGD